MSSTTFNYLLIWFNILKGSNPEVTPFHFYAAAIVDLKSNGSLAFTYLFSGEFKKLDELIIQIDKVINEITTETTLTMYIFLPSLILEYIFISMIVISFVALIKGGYTKLKSIDEDSLLFGMFTGLLGGLLAGLLAGLFTGLFAGLLSGLFFGLFIGLLFSLFNEFK